MLAAQQPEVWIGLVEVRPLPESEILKTSSGAFVYVLTSAIDGEIFQNRAATLMSTLHVQIVGLSQVEPVREKLERDGLSEELQDIADDVARNPEFIRYSTFHGWSDPAS
jgi:hypothetical protein